MTMSTWDDFCNSFFYNRDLGMALDFSKSFLGKRCSQETKERLTAALIQMQGLEAGEMANPDENRMVGHFWLRNPALAPTEKISSEIHYAVESVVEFSKRILDGHLLSPNGKVFKNILLIGIGGSALGPRFFSQAFCANAKRPLFYFADNTDPDGFSRIHQEIRNELDSTLFIVASKSGRTRETLNALDFFQKACGEKNFPAQAVSITTHGSELEKRAKAEKWLGSFPLWDFVGGRFSSTSAIGLLCLSLLGCDVADFLSGARTMDNWTRETEPDLNPACLLVNCWLQLQTKQMAVIAYRDSLSLFSQFLQQLVMESVGKAHTRDGAKIHSGLTIIGNKGSSDQHSYMQQLMEGPKDNLTLLVSIKKNSSPRPYFDAASDYLAGFFYGTRRSLYQAERASVSIILDSLTPTALGGLIALFERAVGLYAECLNINAYNQPGVEAGKKAANQFVELKAEILSAFQAKDEALDAKQIADKFSSEAEDIFFVMESLVSAMPDEFERLSAASPQSAKYRRRKRA